MISKRVLQRNRASNARIKPKEEMRSSKTFSTNVDHNTSAESKLKLSLKPQFSFISEEPPSDRFPAGLKMIRSLRWALRAQIFIILACGVLLGSSETEKLGDRLQVALPAAGLACAIANGAAVHYFVKFASTMAVVHGLKRGLGDAQINLRPSGSQQGFPSGHTASAVFGASYLVNDCLQRSKFMQGAVILGGAYVGASRVEAGKHFLFQVMVGALVGWFGEQGGVFFRGLRSALRRCMRTRIGPKPTTMI